MKLSFLTLFSTLLLTLSVPAFGDQDLKGILEAIVKIRAMSGAMRVRQVRLEQREKAVARLSIRTVSFSP